tara:strand:- start:1429 stop:2232 length:804 start_codon:yes stop_codon:yes gene_type:complete
MSGWGKGVDNNTIGWGRGSTNDIGWGSIYANSPGGDTALEVSTPSYSNVYSASLDGVDDYVTMGNVLDFDRSDAFSVSMWVKLDTAGTDIFISKSTAGGGGWELFTYSNLLYFQMIEVSSSRKIITRGGTTFPTGVWKHVVLTYDGSSTWNGVQIYIDAVAETMADTGSSTLIATTLVSADFNVCSRDNGNLPFHGLADEVGVFNSELSASDVTAIYNSGVPESLLSYSPVGYWRFESGSGTTATDTGSGGNNGTLVNGATFSTDIP